MKKSLEQRFYAKLHKTDKCWEWGAYKCKDGYGRIKVNGTSMLAHRVSFMLHNGFLHDSLLVMHSCDNPSCVNPEHLKQGTGKDNALDCISKNRHPLFRRGIALSKGEKHLMAKLTEDEALDIKKSKFPRAALAIKYGVCYGTIYSIQKDLRWKHLTGGQYEQ